MNIYIKAMEIGYYAKEGLAYNQIKERIEKDLDIDFDINREYTFIGWFINNFASVDFTHLDRKQILNDIHVYLNQKSNSVKYLNVYNKLGRSVFHLTGEATSRYLEYVELKEARETSIKANRFSRWSIGIATVSFVAAIAAVLIPIIITSDVNVVSDQTINDERAKEILLKDEKIKKLLDELQKADLLIEMYEGEGIQIK